MPAKSRLFLTFLLLLVSPLLVSGCLSSRKKKRERVKSIPTAVEQDLKTRWVEKRSAELTVQGIDFATALRQAEAEFRQRYRFTKTAQR